VPVLFEKEPPPPRPAKQPYLEALKACQVYVLMIANEYGQPDGEVSATHHEYRLAQKLKLPTIVFSRAQRMTPLAGSAGVGGGDEKRWLHLQAFSRREDLKPLMLSAIQRTLAEAFRIQATAAEKSEGEQLIEAASTFESAVLTDVTVAALDPELISEFNCRISGNPAERVSRSVGQALHARGLAVRGTQPDEFNPTAAAYLLFGPQPANRFPHCEFWPTPTTTCGSRAGQKDRAASTHRWPAPWNRRSSSWTITRFIRAGGGAEQSAARRISDAALRERW